MRLFITAFLILSLLSACGHKGPLYLPQVEDKDRASTEAVDKK